MGRSSSLRAFAVVGLACGMALAQGKPKSVAEELNGPAREAFEQAKDLFEAADFVTAHAKYKGAFALSKNPRILWNMAACSARQKRYAQAIAEAERYLAEAGSTLTADQVARTTTALGDWRAFVATATLTVTPGGAEVRIDDEPRGVANGPMTVYLDAGRHEVVLSRAGHEPLTQAVVVRELGKVSYAFALKPLSTEPTRLVVSTDADGTIELDGKATGRGLYDAVVTPGTHRLRIVAPGKAPYENTIDVAAGATKQLTIALSAERNLLASSGARPPSEEGGAWWPWALGGAVAASAAVGTFFLLRPEAREGARVDGTLATVEVR